MSERPEDHRRKWDKDEFERIAEERLKAELDEEERSKKKGRNSLYYCTPFAMYDRFPTIYPFQIPIKKCHYIV